MSQQNILQLLEAKSLLIMILFVLVFLLLLVSIVGILVFKKKMKILILSSLALVSSMLIFNHIDAKNIEIKNNIELNSSFFGLLRDKVEIVSVVKLNDKTNLIEKVSDIFFVSNNFFGTDIIDGNYKIMNNGKNIRVKITTKDGSTKSTLLEVPISSTIEINPQEQRELPEVDLKDEIIRVHQSEILKIAHNILIASILLSIFIIILIILFIGNYKKSKLNTDKINI